MTDNPIAPPHDQVYRWWEEACKRPPSSFYEKLDYVAAKAAQQGADQELEACCEWLPQFRPQGDLLSAWLRAARRPKSKKLAEEALEALTKIEDNAATYLDSSVVRRALKRLQELEGQGDD